VQRLVLVFAVAALAGAASAQPRTPDWRPDLSGVWTNASVTQLQRPPNLGPTLTEAEARKLAAASPLVALAINDARPTNPEAGAPASGGAVGGFNSFWMDSGDSYAKVKGQYRTSWIVEPADGQLPFTAAGRARFAEAALTRARENPAGPEHLSPNDRCIIGSRGSGGPGMLNNVYNSNYQIVQTPASIAIVVEMAHDVRAIPILASRAAAQATHKPAAMAQWLGDSVAWWEGATLVIETLNVHPQQGVFGPIFQSPQARVTERLTRASEREIFYEFTVEDPVYYTRPWRAEMTLSARPGQVYEYACHEGNYAIVGILGAARRAEAGAGR
jgi:hypothetical protein